MESELVELRKGKLFELIPALRKSS